MASSSADKENGKYYNISYSHYETASGNKHIESDKERRYDQGIDNQLEYINKTIYPDKA